MSVAVRWDQCCSSTDCTRPARHGDLCSACFMAASPARRATELLCDAGVLADVFPAAWVRRAA